MAGIGFELRKLFREQGLLNNVKAYAYSSLTTVGPMILCILLILGLQHLMIDDYARYMEWELYIATVSYCFIFSIVLTCGVSIVLTRYVADQMYNKQYGKLMSSFYGALIFMLPLCSIIAILFLSGVSANLGYKLASYFFFILLVIVWLQGIYLSALKDYIRIARGFIIGACAAALSGWILHEFTAIQETTAALLSLDIGFFMIALLSFYHFEQKFPKGDSRYYFEFFSYFRKYSSLFFAGCFIYSGVYLHNFVYWLGPRGVEIADQFRVLPFYDLPVFYSFLSVMPTLVMFVVSVETSFYEKFKVYYLNILNGGTMQDITAAKKQMQKTLIREISFLMEIQLVFTVIGVALGIKFLPTIGFTMEQLDLFIILALSYFLFITMFVLAHILMYFDDRKGVLLIGGLFFLLNIGFTYWMMMIGMDGLGMFIASFVSLAAVIARILYVLRNIDYYTFCSQPLVQKERFRAKSFLMKPGPAVSVLLTMTLVLSGCTVFSYEDEVVSLPGQTVEQQPLLPLSSDKLVEDKRLYERDEDGSLRTLYVTVLPSRPDVERPIDWYEMNKLPKGEKGHYLDIIVQEGLGNGQGPHTGMFGYGTDKANATITIRGNSAWNTPQKSYRLKLFNEAGLWMDQRVFNLNKHIMELSRIRNKLSFDLMETIPDITSLRTQFVHLYLKDLTDPNGNGDFVDYGLYTHVEQPNKTFLKSHMLDPNGYLYKAAFFEFERYEDVIKSHDDPEYDRELFEEYLEIKGREDHEKLIHMVEDVNNYGIPIEKVMEDHFELDNFLTWTAINILMDNMDTDAHNYFLYSPLNTEKWYFLPWDYDGGFEMQRRNDFISEYQGGISNNWVTVLHNRYFRKMENVALLQAKLEELMQYINKDVITELIEKYRPVVEPFLHRDPDKRFLPGFASDFENELEIIKNTPERSMQRFLEDLEKPKPFYQFDVVEEDGMMRFEWGKSFDLQGDDLEYDLTIARDTGLTNIVASYTNLKETWVDRDSLSPGRYFWRVISRDSQGNEQLSFDYYRDSEGVYNFGMRIFEVE